MFESGAHRAKINQALILDLDFIELEAGMFQFGEKFRQILITGFERSTLKM